MSAPMIEGGWGASHARHVIVGKQQRTSCCVVFQREKLQLVAPETRMTSRGWAAAFAGRLQRAPRRSDFENVFEKRTISVDVALGEERPHISERVHEDAPGTLKKKKV